MRGYRHAFVGNIFLAVVAIAMTVVFSSSALAVNGVFDETSLINADVRRQEKDFLKVVRAKMNCDVLVVVVSKPPDDFKKYENRAKDGDAAGWILIVMSFDIVDPGTGHFNTWIGRSSSVEHVFNAQDVSDVSDEMLEEMKKGDLDRALAKGIEGVVTRMDAHQKQGEQIIIPSSPNQTPHAQIPPSETFSAWLGGMPNWVKVSCDAWFIFVGVVITAWVISSLRKRRA